MQKYQLLQFLAALLVSIGTFIFGITLGWNAPAVPKLQGNSRFTLSPSEVAWAVSVMPLGGSLSCVLAGMIRNRFGTKALIATCAFPSIIGWILLIFPKNFWMLIFGRLISGIAAGGFLFIVPTYIGEIASKEIRGRLVCLVEITIKFGVIFVYILGTATAFWILSLICSVIVVIFLNLISCKFLPETPVFLVKKEKLEEARDVLAIFRKDDHDIEEELNELQDIQPKALNELLNPATRKAFKIIFVLFILFQSCGGDTIASYSTQILINSGMKFDPFFCTILLGFVQVFGVFLAIAFVDHKGRKFLLYWSFLVMGYGLLVNGVFLHIHPDSKFQSFTWIPFAGLIIYFIGFNLGLAPVSFVLMSEIFSISSKKVVAPLGMTANFVTSFFITLAFPLISAHVGMHLMFYFFAFSCIVGIIFTWKFIPETKGKSLKEIQNMLD